MKKNEKTFIFANIKISYISYSSHSSLTGIYFKLSISRKELLDHKVFSDNTQLSISANCHRKLDLFSLCDKKVELFPH